jgi:hypothetical protein
MHTGTGMHAACMLHVACMNRRAWTGMHAAAATAAAACMRACVVTRVIDTMYQLIYSSAQTQTWRIGFPYRIIRESYAR